MERPSEGRDFHRDQLDDRTVAHLLTMDLANKPDAQAALLAFLKAMGVAEGIIEQSSLGKTAAAQADFARVVKGADAAETVADITAH